MNFSELDELYPIMRSIVELYNTAKFLYPWNKKTYKINSKFTRIHAKS
jgi:hypothetical protein